VSANVDHRSLLMNSIWYLSCELCKIGMHCNPNTGSQYHSEYLVSYISNVKSSLIQIVSQTCHQADCFVQCDTANSVEIHCLRWCFCVVIYTFSCLSQYISRAEDAERDLRDLRREVSRPWYNISFTWQCTSYCHNDCKCTIRGVVLSIR